MSGPLLPSFLAVSSMAFSTCFSRSLFLSAILLYPSVSSFSLLLLPLFFPNVACALAVAPAPCAPVRVARAMAADFHANLNVAVGVVSGTLPACGSTPLAVWGALPKRRGNAGSDSELPYHSNTFLEVRWDCALSHPHSLTLTLTLTLTLSLSLSLRNLSDCPSARTHAQFLPSHLSHAVSLSSPSSSSSSFSLPLRLIFFFFVLPSSSSSSPPLLLLGFSLLGCRLLLLCSALANPC